jgi:peroxiredoxin
MAPQKLQAGSDMPRVTLPKVGGGEVSTEARDGWKLVVVYRGKHCPICKTYLKTLDGLLDDFKKIDTDVIAISGDPQEKAETEVQEESWRFATGYGLSPDQMRTLGLYISEPRSPEETDRPFPEPGLFVINPQGKVHIVDVSNAPFARPDLNALVKGLTFIQQKQYPIRGTLG